MTTSRSNGAHRAMRTGLMGLVAAALMMALVFNLDRLPFLGGGVTYRAEFTDASGLSAGDPVKVAGIRAGLVREVLIKDDHVVLVFELEEGVQLGDRTEAAVGSGSLLGDPYLRITPAGSGRLDHDAVIPLERTEPAYDVVDAFSDLSQTTEQLDADRISEALDTMADTFEGAGPEVEQAVDGLSRLSSTISSRDQELRELLDNAEGVSQVLAERRDDLGSLITSADLLLAELQQRRTAITELLASTTRLADALRGLVRDNQAQLTPALRHLAEVTAVLEERQTELRDTIRALELYGRLYTNVVGTGPWFDNYIPRTPDTAQVEPAS